MEIQGLALQRFMSLNSHKEGDHPNLPVTCSALTVPIHLKLRNFV